MGFELLEKRGGESPEVHGDNRITIENAFIAIDGFSDDFSAFPTIDADDFLDVGEKPALVPGDAAVDSTMVVDPISGLTFEISVYLGYKKKVIEVAIAWGTKVVQPEHTVILLG